jgi:hypothetical protein
MYRTWGVITICVGILALFMSSCLQDSSTSSVQTNQNYQPYWFVDLNGHFSTNDLQRAQKEIPFNIVVPNYIPDLFGSRYRYEFTGPFSTNLGNAVKVRIQYWDGTHQILIEEYNRKETTIPTEELDPISYEISGIQVLRQITQYLSSSNTTEGLGFYWNIDNLTFNVNSINIPEDEALKIVESLVKRLK